MTRPQREPPSETTLIEALRESLYFAPRWVVLSHVSHVEVNAAGQVTSERRIADVIAVDTYSRGRLRLIGGEVKRTRGDWVTEREDLAKSSGLRAQCEKIYVIVPAPAKDVALHASELLAGRWGLVEVSNRGAQVLVEAPRWEVPPFEPTAELLGAMFRAAQRPLDQQRAGDGGLPLRTIVGFDGQFAILRCGHRRLRPLAKRKDMPVQLGCFDCPEERGPGLARVDPQPEREGAVA